MSTTTLSEMSFIVSNDGHQEISSHSKHSLVMNGSPRSSSQQQRLPSIDTSRASASSFIPNGTIFHSPTDQSSPGHAHAKSDAHSSTYPPVNHYGSRQSVDRNLRIPGDSPSHNRRSSPARFPSEDGSSEVPYTSSPDAAEPSRKSPTMPRLQHRHTLEVPHLASSAQTSTDGPPRASEDLPNGRISNSYPGRRRRGSLSALGRRHTRSYHSDIGLDGQSVDEDGSRLDAIRAKRASRRRRRDDDDDDRVLVGTKVDQNHRNYVTAYNMLTGIRFTVSRNNAKAEREDLSDADFEESGKFSFDITGNQTTPGVKYDFKFKDYAPWVFRRLRSAFDIDTADYLVSLTGKYILSELGSPGKSGSFFYFSRDYRYIIKTIHAAEHKLLRRVLKQYYNHVCKNRNTLLSQFYGLHRVKTQWGKKIHFVVMNNLFPPHRDIHRTFDLKGSLVGRDYREEELEKKPRAVLKDQNWLRRRMRLELGPMKKEAFLDQLKSDVELLKELNIMDYSLLLGIHDLEKGNEERLRDRNLKVFQPGGDQHGDEEVQSPEQISRTPSTMENQRRARELRRIVHNQKPVLLGSSSSRMPDEMPGGSTRNAYFYKDDGGLRATHQDESPGEAIYYLGIIDCLTNYGNTKKAEHFFKGLQHRYEKHRISAVPPKEYGDRFVKFMEGITMSKEQAARVDSEKLGTPVPDGPFVHLADHEVVPDRTRSTIDGPDGMTQLPVVEEVGEASSTGGRSAHSSRSRNRGEHHPIRDHVRKVGSQEGHWEATIRRGGEAEQERARTPEMKQV